MSATESLSGLVKSEPDRQRAAPETEAERFLRFSLGGKKTGLLFLNRLIEVIRVRPTEILPIPKVPDYLLGIINRRGEAVWILDLLYLMGANHLSRREIVPSVCMAMILQAQDQAIGLLVEQVSSIETYNLQNLQSFSPQMLPSKLLSFLEGYFVDSKGITVVLLDVDAIIEAVENWDSGDFSRQ
jgi:chemotaxis signal transduction protein